MSAAPFTPSEGRDLLRGHVIDQYQHHLHLTISIFKGITIGAAAYSFLGILASGRTIGDLAEWTAISFWAASFFMVISSYDGMMVNSLVAVTPPNVLDIILPFVLCIGEFVMFPILNPQFSGLVTPGLTPTGALRSLAWWPLAATCLTAVGLVFMANTQGSLTRSIDELPPEFHAFLRWFKAEIRKNQVGSAIGGCVSFVLFLAFRYGAPHVWLLDRLPSAAHLRRWEALLGPVLMIGAISGIFSEERVRHRFAAVFADAIDAADSSEVPAASLQVAGVDEA